MQKISGAYIKCAANNSSFFSHARQIKVLINRLKKTNRIKYKLKAARV